jgi:hypothetical protein
VALVESHFGKTIFLYLKLANSSFDIAFSHCHVVESRAKMRIGENVLRKKRLMNISFSFP